MRWVAFMLLFGCGDNLEGITLEERYALEAAARCKQLARCGLFPTEGACNDSVRDKTDRALAAAVDAGVVRFDTILLRQCLEDLAQVSCDQTSRSFRIKSLSCQGMLLGARSAGQDCRFDVECATARCTEGICEPYECCQGTCKEARKPFGPCDDNADCFEKEYCSSERGCAPLERELGPCINDSACDFGLACIGASSVAYGTCRKLPAIGQACPYGRCANIGARCDTSGMCVAVGLPGDSCASETDCSPYAQCNQTSGRCEALPSLGMPCTGRCGGNAACFERMCVAPLEDGTPCGGNNDCESGLCAEGLFSHTCMPAPTCF